MNFRAPVSLIIVLALVGMLPAAARAQGFNLGFRLDLTPGTMPTSVVVGDLNGDGKLDLVAGNGASGTVSVWLGDGLGGYGAKTDWVTSLTSSNTATVAIADMNGDGKSDIVVANSNQDSLVVLLGTGLGAFLPRITTYIGFAAYPIGLAIADFNNDGKLDVTTTDPSFNAVLVLLGNGAGGFFLRNDYAAGQGPSGVVVADVNGDTKPDLIVSDYGDNTISILLGDNSGNFYTRTTCPTGAGPYSLTVGDLNGDGNLDVVTSNYTQNSISVLTGNGAGGFTYALDYSIASTVFAAAIGDLNGDGKADIALANFGGSAITVLLGNGSGGFGSRADFATGYNPADVTIADVNGDGRADIVTAVRNAGQVSVLFGNGSGQLGARSDMTAGAHPEAVAIGDLNGDGKPDLAIANTTSNTVSIMTGNGGGGFAPKVDVSGLSGPAAVAIGDMNGDAQADIVVANYSANTVVVLSRAASGGGYFSAVSSGATGPGPTAVAIGDLNGDGKSDVVTANFGASTVSVLLNNGTGGLLAKTDITTGTSPNAVAIADINGDGKPDLVVLNYGSNTGSVLISNGNGTFAPKVDFNAPSGPSALAIGDMNGDGYPEIAVTGENSGTVRVLMGNGTATYNSYYELLTGSSPTSVAMVDLNGDGRPDLVTANYGASTISVLLGNGTGFAGPKVDVAAATNPQGIAAGDLNGDGRPDIAVANYGSNSASVLLTLERTRTAFNASPMTAVLNSPVTLTASVSVAAPGSGAPTGTVSFFDGKTPLGTSPVTGGVAALSMFAPRLAYRSLSAVYNGDGKLLGSNSPTITQKVVSTATPKITLIHDVLNDQGRIVRTRFRASPFDYAGSGTPIVRYDVFRQVNPALGPSSVQQVAASQAVSRSLPGPARVLVDGWDYVGSATAYTDSAYDVVVPTVADSNSSGMHRSVFFVRAVSGNASVFYDSPPDSGYSVDNLPPVAPSPFTAAYVAGATNLHWGPNSESDLWYYRMYRGSSSGFIPAPGNLIATRSDTGYADVGPKGSYYKLSAVDLNGNESLFATLGPGNTLAVGDGGPVAFALEPMRPNPTRGRNLTIEFALVSDAPARIEMLDVSGRRVISREVGPLGPGRHAIALESDRALPPGLYLVRLTCGPNSRVARVTVVE
jgi:Bacterial Ig-like domain (group 3)/FG-GAP-like repeat/FG-GAP repeat